MRGPQALVPTLALLALCSADGLAPPATPRTAWAHDDAPACPSTSGDARELVPRDAMAIIGIDAAALRGSVFFRDVEAMARAHPAVAMVLTPLESCGVALADHRGLTIGLSPHGEAVVIAVATGLGRAATLRCIGTELRSTLGVAPWTRRSTGCTSVLELAGGKGRGFAIDDDTVVVATRGWASSVGDRVAERGRSAKTGTLSWAWSRVDVSRTVWFAANVPATAARRLGPHAAGLREVGGTVDAPDGLEVHVTGGFGDADEAAAARRAIEAQVHRLRLAAPMFGIPFGVVDGLAVTAHGTRLELTAKISASDLRELRGLLEGNGEASMPAARPNTARPGI